MQTVQRPAVVAGMTLVRKVGSGGEGEVWEARAPNGEQRAVKLVRPEAMASPEQVVARGDWLRRIDHPSLVRVRRTGMLAEPNLVGWGLVEMDFIEGQDLTGARARGNALERLKPLAEGLDLLHLGHWSGGVPLVHRDVKPANLIATADGRVVLVDCSSLCGVDRTMLTRIGTPLFAAPEVITGRIGPASDVYSFAATIVALVTGARREALRELLDDPSTIDVHPAVRRGLDPDISERPERCASLLEPPRIRTSEEWLPAYTGVVDLDEVHDDIESQDDPSAVVPPNPPAPAGSVYDYEAGAGTVYDYEAGESLVPAPPPRVIWPFLTLLATVGFLLGGAAVRPADLGRTWVMGAVAVSVIAHLGARKSPLAALIVPPISWAFLLAERTSTSGDRTAWARVTLAGTLTVAVAFAALSLDQAGVAASASFLTVLIAGALLVTAVVVTVGRTHGQAGVWGRIGLTPFTLCGGLLMIAGAIVTSPLLLLRNETHKAAWLLKEAFHGVHGIVELSGDHDGDDFGDEPAEMEDPHATYNADNWSML